MIKGFKHRGLKRFFEKGDTSKVQPAHIERLQILLFALNEAAEIAEMDLPGFGLHALKGDLKNHWAVKVSSNWRMTFIFENGNAYVVDYQDYH